MSLRSRIAIVVVWAASLVAVGTLASGQAYSFDPLPEPIMLSGSDIGYRVEGWRGAMPAGRLMVRIDGKWLDAASSPGPQPVR